MMPCCSRAGYGIAVDIGPARPDAFDLPLLCILHLIMHQIARTASVRIEVI